MGDDGPDYGEPDYGEPEYDQPEYEPPEHDWDQGEPKSEFVHWPRDPKLDEAAPDLLKWFEDNPNGVFYGRQLEVLFEKKYFHWITHKALRELTNSGAIATEIRTTVGGNQLRLYWSKRNRFYKRAAAAIVKLVEEHTNPDLSKAIGHHAEALFGVAAGREGFHLHGPAINAFQGKTWYVTEHDLDWIFERDGIAWGVEIKNTWAYIDRAEMRIKIALCRQLGVSPLFIMRWAPKSYVEEIRKEGGFGLLYETQYFPVGHSAAVAKLKELSLPVESLTAVPPAVFRRFVKHGHEPRVRR